MVTHSCGTGRPEDIFCSDLLAGPWSLQAHWSKNRVFIICKQRIATLFRNNFTLVTGQQHKQPCPLVGSQSQLVLEGEHDHPKSELSTVYGWWEGHEEAAENLYCPWNETVESLWSVWWTVVVPLKQKETDPGSYEPSQPHKNESVRSFINWSWLNNSFRSSSSLPQFQLFRNERQLDSLNRKRCARGANFAMKHEPRYRTELSSTTAAASFPLPSILLAMWSLSTVGLRTRGLFPLRSSLALLRKSLILPATADRIQCYLITRPIECVWNNQ